MAAEESIFVAAGAGHVIKMDLPLHEAVADQLKKGHLRRVVADGTPYVGPAGGDNPPAAPKPPAQSASKAEWVGYAVRHPDESRRMSPDDAEALTKADLIERFGKD